MGNSKDGKAKEATLTDKQRQTRSTKMKVERYTNFSRNPKWAAVGPISRKVPNVCGSMSFVLKC
jgi:hypothetical protein